MISDEALKQRLAAYDQAVAQGCVRYGRRGKAKSAVQAAGEALGFSTSGPILAALRQGQHDDLKSTVARRRAAATAKRVAKAKKEKISAAAKQLSIRAAKVAKAASKKRRDLKAERKAEKKAVRDRKQKERMGLPIVGFDGNRQLRTDEVANPFGLDGDEGREFVMRNMRGASLRAMWQRKQLDDVSFVVGDRVAEIYARAEIGGVGAFVYDRPCVDGGAVWVDAPSTMIDAHGMIKRMGEILGEERLQLLRLIVVDNEPMEKIARKIEIRATGRVAREKALRNMLRDILFSLRNRLFRDLKDVRGVAPYIVQICSAERRVAAVDALEDAKEALTTARTDDEFAKAKKRVEDAEAAVAATVPKTPRNAAVYLTEDEVERMGFEVGV